MHVCVCVCACMCAHAHTHSHTHTRTEAKWTDAYACVPEYVCPHEHTHHNCQYTTKPEGLWNTGYDKWSFTVCDGYILNVWLYMILSFSLQIIQLNLVVSCSSSAAHSGYYRENTTLSINSNTSPLIHQTHSPTLVTHILLGKQMYWSLCYSTPQKLISTKSKISKDTVLLTSPAPVSQCPKLSTHQTCQRTQYAYLTDTSFTMPPNIHQSKTTKPHSTAYLTDQFQGCSCYCGSNTCRVIQCPKITTNQNPPNNTVLPTSQTPVSGSQLLLYE